MRRRSILLSAFLALTTLAFTSIDANAANPQGASGDGKAWAAGLKYRGRSVGRRIRHAREYTGAVRSYATQAPQVVPMLGPEHAEEVGRNITAAKKDLETTSKDAKGDKDVLARIAAIEKHLEAASAQQKIMHEECCKENADGGKTMACCTECMKHLDAAQKEHDALMKKVDPDSAKEDSHKDHDHHK